MKKIFFLLLIFITVNIKAQNGAAGAQELLFPVGARSLALNNSIISNISGIEAIYYNPAGLVKTTHDIVAMFSYMNYIADIGMSYTAAATNIEGFGALGLSFKSIDIGEIPVTTTQAPYGTGDNFSPAFIVAGLTYSRNISDNILIGTTVNIIFEKIIGTSATGTSFDFGFQYYNAGVQGLGIGAVLKNLGPEMSFDGPELLRTAIDTSNRSSNQFYKIESATFPLPLQIRIGAAYENKIAEKYSYVLSGAYSSGSYSDNEITIGAEFIYDDLFFVRGGYINVLSQNSSDQNVFGTSFGAGLRVNTIFNLSVDYAYRTVEKFKANQMITLKIYF
jgi:hypothetical protein